MSRLRSIQNTIAAGSQFAGNEFSVSPAKGHVMVLTEQSGSTVDLIAKLDTGLQTVQRVVLSTSASANTAGQSFTFANNPVTALPWNVTDFDEIFIEHVIGGSIYSKVVRALDRDDYWMGELAGGVAVTIDLNANSIDLGNVGQSHHVIGINYV